PRPETDEAGNEIDLKEELIRRLLEYKQFKVLTEKFRELEGNRFMHEKRGNIRLDIEQIEWTTDPGEELDSFDLYKLLLTYHKLLLKSTERESKPEHLVELYPYDIETQKKTILQLMQINRSLDFNTLAANSENKVHFVYNFLAILEMLQQEILSIQIGL